MKPKNGENGGAIHINLLNLKNSEDVHKVDALHYGNTFYIFLRLQPEIKTKEITSNSFRFNIVTQDNRYLMSGSESCHDKD